MAYSSALSAFTFDATTIKAVGSVAFSLQRAPLDVTSIGAWNTYFIDGVASSAFTLDVFFDIADHTKLMVDILNPASGASRPKAFIITLKNVAGAVQSISGNCIVTSFDVVTTTADVVRGSFACQVVGPITFTTNTTGDLADTGTAETIPS